MVLTVMAATVAIVLTMRHAQLQPESTTIDGNAREQEGQDASPEGIPAVPGLIVIFSGGQPAAQVIAIPEGEVTVGRDSMAGLAADMLMSRRHARIVREGRQLWATDLGSRNGTWADGALVPPAGTVALSRFLRAGDTLFRCVPDVRPFQKAGVRRQSDFIIGPGLQAAHLEIARMARVSSTLHIGGESGTGKEQGARVFHASGPRSAGPFVPVNCAVIPAGVAERLLFGCKKGAYSGAQADEPGYIQAADGGTLFLDELADLDAEVQAKLLRVIENREVLVLGSVRPRPIDVRICSAAHRDLRSQVKSGRMREDLYYRLGRPEVKLPPLRERAEEIPWLVDVALKRVAAELCAHVSLIDTCLWRPWPGNVRELLTEIAMAAHAAIARDRTSVEGKDLATAAGMPILDPTCGAVPTDARPAPDAQASPSREEVDRLLWQLRGNVSSVARALGLHRTALRRWLEQHSIDSRQFRRRTRSGQAG